MKGLAVSATIAAATGATSAPQENTELFNVADALHETLAAYFSARTDVTWIVAEWSLQLPMPDP